MGATHRVGKYYLKKKIGEGAFAEVRLAEHVETGEEYAVKIFDRRSMPAKEFEKDVRREIQIMRSLNHPNIVKVHAVLVTDKSLYLVMELVRGGELYDHIVRHTRISEQISRRYFQQIVDGLVYCHKRGVYHRDLKPENLLLDEYGRIRITDFGMSFMKEKRDSSHLLQTQCGTVGSEKTKSSSLSLALTNAKYMPPEIIVRSKKGYDGAKLDAWECGMVLFALLAGHLPFHGEDDKAVFRSILHSDLEIPPYIPDGARDVLIRLLEKNPKKRTSLSDIRYHPWFLVDYVEDSQEPVFTEPFEFSHVKSTSETPKAAPRKQQDDAHRVRDARPNGVVSGDRPPTNPETIHSATSGYVERDFYGINAPGLLHEKNEEDIAMSNSVVPRLEIRSSGGSADDSGSTFRKKLSSIPGMILRTLKSPRRGASKDGDGVRSNGLPNEEDDTPDWFAGSPASIMEAGLQNRRTFVKDNKNPQRSAARRAQGKVASGAKDSKR